MNDSLMLCVNNLLSPHNDVTASYSNLSESLNAASEASQTNRITLSDRMCASVHHLRRQLSASTQSGKASDSFFTQMIIKTAVEQCHPLARSKTLLGLVKDREGWLPADEKSSMFNCGLSGENGRHVL